MFHIFLMFAFSTGTHPMFIPCKTPQCVVAVAEEARRDPHITGIRVYRPGDSHGYDLNDTHWMPLILNERKA